MARRYHRHQVTRTDGIYSHKIAVTHKSTFGRTEHQKELEAYKKEMATWSSAREEIKDLGGTARKYRKHIMIGSVGSLFTLFLMILAIPGTSITDWDGKPLGDIWCGEECHLDFIACSEFYKISINELPISLEPPNKGVIDHYEDEFGNYMDMNLYVIPFGQCVKARAVIFKDKFDSLKYTIQAGGIIIDPWLYSMYISAPENNAFDIGKKNFQSNYKRSILDSGSLEYRLGDKYIAFTPIEISVDSSSIPIKTIINSSKTENKNEYKGVFGEGIDIEILESDRIWSKRIIITNPDLISLIPNEAKNIEIKFIVETNFIINGWNRSEIFEINKTTRLGNLSYIETAKLWNEDGESIKIRSYFYHENNVLYYVKELPIDWIKRSNLPIYTDADISFGTVAQFSSNSIAQINPAATGTAQFVVCYEDDTAGGDGCCTAATISGSTITYGSESCFDTDISGALKGEFSLQTCKLDTDKFVVVYTDDGDDDGDARAATISTRTIGTWGTVKEFESSDTEWASCASLGTDKFVVCYNNEGSGDQGMCKVCTVSGTTITCGSDSGHLDGGTTDYYPKYTSTCGWGTDKFVTCFDSEDIDDSFCSVMIVSGKTIGTPEVVTLSTDEYVYHGVTCPDTDKYIVTAMKSDYDGFAAACTVSGTTSTCSAYSEFEADLAEQTQVMAVNDTWATVAYQNNLDPGVKGQTRRITVDWTDRSMDFGNIVSFEGGAIGGGNELGLGIDHLGSGKLVICFQDDDDSDSGKCIIGTVTLPAEEDVCDCPASGNWVVEGSDNCVISNTCDLQDNDFLCYGSGSFTVQADITNYNYGEARTGCNIICDGGCFV